MQSITFLVKRLIAFVFVGLCFFCVKFVKRDFNYLNLFNGVEKSCFVVKVNKDDQKQEYEQIEFDLKDFDKVRGKTDIETVMIYLKNSNMDDFLSKFKVESVRQASGEKEILMGYSPYIDFFEVVDGKRYNLQVLKEDSLVVGFPKILDVE